MATCISCGEELDPERAAKYDYCTKPECRVPRAEAVAITPSIRRPPTDGDEHQAAGASAGR